MSLPISVLSPGRQCAGMKQSKPVLCPAESQSSLIFRGVHHGSTIWTSENYWEDVGKLDRWGNIPRRMPTSGTNLKVTWIERWSGDRRFNVESMVVHTCNQEDWEFKSSLDYCLRTKSVCGHSSLVKCFLGCVKPWVLAPAWGSGYT